MKHLIISMLLLLMSFPVMAQTNSTKVSYFGYVPNKSYSVDTVQESKIFQDKMTYARINDTNEDVFLYRYLVNVLQDIGEDRWLRERDGVLCLRAYDQGSVGSCVGNATALCISIRAAYEIEVLGDAEEFKAMGSADGMYGIAREAAGMLKQNSDGCTGYHAGVAISKYGSLYMMKYSAENDLTVYTDRKAKQLGYYGVGDFLLKAAAEHKFEPSIPIKTVEDAWTCIGIGIPLNVCSNVGFHSARDKFGVCKPNETWWHSMAVIARRTRDGNREYLIQNSWADDWNKSPYYQDMPWGSFWITEDVMKRMIDIKDTFGYTGLDGFQVDRVPGGKFIWLLREESLSR